MSFEENFNWIYTFLMLPIALSFQKHFALKNRVTKIETTLELYVKKVDKICESMDNLTKEVHEMIGELREHRRTNSS